ncbi:MAG: DUF4838 domain-containing protein, partial [bacterium]
MQLRWRGQQVISGSYLRLARPNYQGEDYLYFRSGKATIEGNKMEVPFRSAKGDLDGTYSLELSEKGLLVSLSLKLNDPTLPSGPREYAVGMFPEGLVEGQEYELEVPLGKAQGSFPKEPPERARDYGPSFIKARIKTNGGFAVQIEAIEGGRLLFHDARGSDWFPGEDRRIWIWAPSASVGNGLFLKTSVFISCEEIREEKEEGEILLIDRGEEIPLKGIVVPADSPIEKAAGKELGRYLEMMTGAKVPIFEGLRGGEGFIFVGKLGFREEEFANFKDDGFIIRQRGGNLFLSGKNYRGTIFAVYRLLEMLGCKFLAREEEIIPRTKKLRIEVREIKENPAFEWRYFDATIDGLKCYLDPGIRDEVISGEKVPAVLGAPAFWHHPMNGYIPLEKYGQTHPEYYCLIEGKRWPELKRYSGWDERVLFHPCVSNPEVRKVILDTLLPLMDSHPDARYFTVHAGDSDFWCQCERCNAMDVDPNIKSDRMVQFTNAIAEVVAKHHPDKFVTMLAYVKAYRPPLRDRPKENVLIWFCPIGACQIHPWRAPCNKENYEVLLGWIEKHPSFGMGILTFDYPINYAYIIEPFPTLFAYLENLKLYKRLHIRGLYICGIDGKNHLSHLFSYVVPRMMWNPDAMADKYINEFLAGWYGPAAPFMKDYLRLLRELVMSGKACFNPWTLPPKELFTPEFFLKAYGIFEEAERACRGNELYLSRLWKEKAGLLFADLSLYWDFAKFDAGEMVSQPSEWQLKKLAEFLRICAYFEWNNIMAWTPFMDWVGERLGYRPQASGWYQWWEEPVIKQFIENPLETYENIVKPKLKPKTISLESGELKVEIVPSLGGRIRSIYVKKEGIELLWRPAMPPLYSGERWRDFGGYEEYAGEELGAPGWKEEYAVDVSPDGRSAILTCRLPKGLVLRRRITLLDKEVGLEISSSIKNEGKEEVEGVVLRIHPEFSFAKDSGAIFMAKNAKGEWIRIELKPEDNFLKREDFAGGEVKVVDEKERRSLINIFNPQEVEKYMIYNGKDFYNLEIYSPKRNLKPGEEISITHRYI